MRRELALVAALAAAVPGGADQEERSRLPSTETTAVVVDVVVRDGKGRPVTDLTAADFEVLEDGVPQAVERFVPPDAVTLLAHILAADGRPVEAMSRRFVFDPQSESKGVDLCFLRDAWLPPGRYTLEAVAYEAGASRAGVVTTDLEVGDGERTLDRPQVVIVRGALPAAGAPVDFETGHPLRFGDVILLPLAGEPVPREPPRPLVFQLATTAASGAILPQASVGVWQGETRVGQGAVKWGAPDPSGLQRYVGEAPTGTLRAGRYELRVSLRDGTGERILRAPFVVTE